MRKRELFELDHFFSGIVREYLVLFSLKFVKSQERDILWRIDKKLVIIIMGRILLNFFSSSPQKKINHKKQKKKYYGTTIKKKNTNKEYIQRIHRSHRSKSPRWVARTICRSTFHPWGLGSAHSRKSVPALLVRNPSLMTRPMVSFLYHIIIWTNYVDNNTLLLLLLSLFLLLLKNLGG